MQKRSLVGLMLVVAAVIAACSSGSGLTGKTWQLTAITEVTPAFQGVVPADQQADYTIQLKTDGTFNPPADRQPTPERWVGSPARSTGPCGRLPQRRAAVRRQLKLLADYL